MSSEDIDSLERIISRKTKRLSKLKEQEAIQGIATDPAIKIEIEELTKEVTELKKIDTGSDPKDKKPKESGKGKGGQNWEFVVTISLVVFGIAYYLGGLGNGKVITNPYAPYEKIGEENSAWSEIIGAQTNPAGDILYGYWTESEREFPGEITDSRTNNFQLLPGGSLKVATMVHNPGHYYGFLHRNGIISPRAATIYVMTPQLDGIDLKYIQLCVSKPELYCSDGVKLTPGMWTPVTLDLGKILAEKPGLGFDQLEVRWRYEASRNTVNFDLYFDYIQIFNSGPI